MIYKVVSTIKNPNTDDFIGQCKKNLRRTILVSLLLILAVAFFGYWLFVIDPPTENIVRIIPAAGFVLTFFGSALSLMFLFGNMASEGSVFARCNCKTIRDWVNFAQKYTLLPDTVVLTKRLEVEEKEIVKVHLDSKELWCRNTKTGADEIISLSKEMTFRDKFTIKENPSLADNEMVIDLSGKELVAFVRRLPRNRQEWLKF